MADIRYIQGKKDKQFLFEVKLDWLTASKGILTSTDVKDTIRVALPSAFGGEKDQWSPEHLFLAAISSCFMTTYIAFVNKMGFNISHFECNSAGQVEIDDGKYVFTTINVYPKIYIADDSLKEKAIAALQKTQKYCLVSNSIRSHVIYHGEVMNIKHIQYYKGIERGEVIEK